MNELVSQPGIVLSTQVLRESDLLLHILGRDTGRISALARSARNSKKRFMGGIDIFDYAKFDLSHGPDPQKWYTIREIHDRHRWGGYMHAPVGFAAASLCLEITKLFTAEGDSENGQLLAPLYMTLRSLEKSKDELEQVAVAAHYVLVVHRVGGFDAAEENSGSDPGTAAWFNAMRQSNQPIVPHDRQVLIDGLGRLVSYSEQTLERALRSAPEIRSMLVRLQEK